MLQSVACPHFNPLILKDSRHLAGQSMTVRPTSGACPRAIRKRGSTSAAGVNRGMMAAWKGRGRAEAIRYTGAWLWPGVVFLLT